MYNIKAAVSRLDFAPTPKAMEVTDIETGHFIFSPLRGKKVVYKALEKVIVAAGYKIEKAWIEVTGRLADAHLQIEGSGQIFRLEGAEALSKLQEQIEPGSRVTVFGQWKSTPAIEIIVVQRWSSGSS